MDFNDRELVNNTDVMKLVSRVCYLGEDERKRVFNIPFVRDKLRRELLKTCNEGDTYKNFRWLFNMIDIDDFFTILDYNTIHNFYKKYDGEYKLFVCLTEKNMDKTLQYIFNNDNLFKDFITSLKDYLKKKKYIYVTTDNISTYKMFDKTGDVVYYDTNIIKLFDELSFKKIGKLPIRNVVLETEKTPEETFKLFNANTKRNINLSIRRAINIYKNESNNINPLLDMNNTIKKNKIINIINNFNDDNVKAEVYYAKINPEQYVNNYRYILKEEDKRNDNLNEIMQNINVKKTDSIINKKMNSDKKITKYQNEIIKATGVYTKYPKEVIIGGILIIKNNREIYFLDEAYNKDLEKFYSSHLIKWEIIKKYLNEGYKIFNLGSIKSIDKKDGNYTFKMGFGAKVYEYIGTYDLIINRYLYYFAKFIVKINEMIKRITKK